MRRQRLITILASGIFAWSNPASAESVPVIGFLNSASPQPFAHLVASFHKGLNEFGYVENQNVRVEYRWAQGDESRLRPLARELVDRRVALIAATGGIRSAQTAKDATSAIPILFISGSNPVELGLVASINRPGRNLTGVSIDTTHLIPKRLEVLHELVAPGTKTAVLASPGRYAPPLETKFIEEHKMISARVADKREFEDAFKMFVKEGARALLVSADPFYYNQRAFITELAARHSLPAVYPWREFALAGGLLSYGPSIPDAYRQVGAYAGRILKGDRPEDLPVVFPSKWELVINLKTAKALGLVLSPWLLTRADEAIE
jgi:putative ABC transport system substrate-binding protein